MNELDLSRNVGRCQKYLHNISFALDFYPSFVSKQCNTHLKWQQETIAWLFLPGNSSKIKKKHKTMFTSSGQLKAGVKIACPSQFTTVRNPFKHSFSFHLTAQEHKEKNREKPPKHTPWQVFYIPPNNPRQLRNTLGLYSKNQLADPPCWCLSWKQSNLFNRPVFITFKATTCRSQLLGNVRNLHSNSESLSCSRTSLTIQSFDIVRATWLSKQDGFWIWQNRKWKTKNHKTNKWPLLLLPLYSPHLIFNQRNAVSIPKKNMEN